ncbi:ferritin family protein [Propionispira raffinosivorans]|uniref:ferritin family protein n=1 Tax=Propionispira raffinosivorans TaxID=86959 RepID=UPI0003827E90|nr:ferritin family protein [Propionispira raffinosivorans]
MSLYKITKGTALEKQVDSYMKAEAHGVMLYYALSRLAKEQGLNDLAETLITIANDEARHAGLYAVLNGEVPQDIFAMLAQVQKAEEAGAVQIAKIAATARTLGLDAAAAEIDAGAKDEERHGVILAKILKDYAKA